jgi:hypothetical protein
MDAGDMDTSLASAPDFFAKLVRLETDGLPAYEQRFFELLQNQSHQNLAALSTYLNDARKAILERMDLVNDSLGQVPFNQSANQRTYLHIDASDRQLVDVKEFKQEIQQALSHAWTEDREFAEARFLALRRLVDRLASQDPEQKRWRETVLDVRQHVEFIGREIDESGVEVEIYRSGAGKSGGQRQKLATTCLAAALRYQLGGNDHGVPMYAPVVLDEAFDKADNEFTALAMNIFTNFGFQMVVATPLKSVMTLEPFIGGACFVDISDRRVSGVLLIEYDGDRHPFGLADDLRVQAAQKLVDLQILVVPIRCEAHSLVGADQAAEAVRVSRRRGHPFGLVDDQAGEVAVLLEKAPQLLDQFLVAEAVRTFTQDALRGVEQFRRHDAFERAFLLDPHLRVVHHPCLLELEGAPVVDVVADVLLVGEHLAHRGPCPRPAQIGEDAFGVEPLGDFRLEQAVLDEPAVDLVVDADRKLTSKAG